MFLSSQHQAETRQDAVKCAESLQKLIAVRRNHGDQRQVETSPFIFLVNVELTMRYQLLDSLSNYLPGSAFYTLLSTLSLPDPTSPTSTTIFEAQVAIHNGSDHLDEMISLTETLEEDTDKREVEKRRMRLGAPGPDQLRKEVFRDISSSSQVNSMPFLTVTKMTNSNGLAP